MKRVISLALTLTLLLGAVSVTAFAAASHQAGAAKFTDLHAGVWYYPYIDRLTQEGIITGITEDTFAPTRTISRAEFVSFTIRALGGSTYDNSPGEYWAKGYMDRAYELGIVTEDEMPSGIWTEPITRQEMAAVITRCSETVLKEQPVEDPITTKIADWESLCTVCKPYIAQAYAKGIITGTDGAGTFNGAKTASRGEASCIIVKLMDKSYRTSWYDGIPFIPALDITDTGTMASAAAEKFILKTLEQTQFYTSSGKYYVSCTYPTVLPEGFEVFLSVGVEFTTGKYFQAKTNAIRESSLIPKTGSFTREITGMTSLSDIAYAAVSVSINAPDAETDSYKKYESFASVLADYSSGKLSKLSQWIEYTVGDSKDLNLTYNDIFKW
jgi:hypothetical protein